MSDPGRLVLFVATRREDVPPGLARFASVDGSVPGACVTWDHHVSGERVNLDCLPQSLDVAALEGIGTTLADTDAVVSAVAVALGGIAGLPAHVLDVFRAASHWCDHLVGDPRVDERANELGRGLHDWATRALATSTTASDGFALSVRELLARIERGGALPFEPVPQAQLERARSLASSGRIRVVGRVALIDLRGLSPIEARLVYEQIDAPVAVTADDHPRGGFKYTVGVNPRVEHPGDLSPALADLAALEHTHGPPALRAEPGPGSENWGGRATVFGSPWNYGSRLEPEQVARVIAAALGLSS